MSLSRSGSALRARRVVSPATEIPGPLGSERVRQRLVRALVAGQVALVLGVVLPLGPVLWHGSDRLGQGLIAGGAVLVAAGVVGLGRDLRIGYNED